MCQLFPWPFLSHYSNFNPSRLSRQISHFWLFPVFPTHHLKYPNSYNFNPTRALIFNLILYHPHPHPHPRVFSPLHPVYIPCLVSLSTPLHKPSASLSLSHLAVGETTVLVWSLCLTAPAPAQLKMPEEKCPTMLTHLALNSWSQLQVLVLLGLHSI